MESGAQYIVTNSYSSGSLMIDPGDEQAKRAFYAALDREAELLQELSPTREGVVVPRIFEQTFGPVTHLRRLERPGPVIRIYRLPAPPEAGSE